MEPKSTIEWNYKTVRKKLIKFPTCQQILILLRLTTTFTFDRIVEYLHNNSNKIIEVSSKFLSGF